MEQTGWHEFEEYEAAICGSCGNLRSVCHDPLRQWLPETDICYATADLSVHRRRQSKKNEKAAPTPEGRMPDDGVTLFVIPGEVVDVGATGGASDPGAANNAGK